MTECTVIFYIIRPCILFVIFNYVCHTILCISSHWFPKDWFWYREVAFFFCYILLRAVDQKHLKSFEMWCWWRMEKISWTDHVRNEDVLLRVKEQWNILHEIRKRKANWLVTFCVETAFYNGLLKERYKGG